MTLTKLAELAGTSVATVSKAFSGSKEISEKTRSRIFSLANQHGCFEKYYKAPRNRPMIALIFQEPESEYYSRMIGVFENALKRRGADAVIAFSRFDKERETELFREFAYKMQVDGIILSGKGELIENPDELPLVTLSGSGSHGSNADNVAFDFEGGMSELLRTLKEYGHTEIGFIGEELTAGVEKLFKRTLRREGLRVHSDYFYCSDKRFMAAGEDGMRELIARGTLPSVIVAAYDNIAYGAIKYAASLGYRVPEDISFVGIDDIALTPYLNVPLSSLHVDVEAVCEKIVELVFKRIDNRHYRSRVDISVPVSLHVRESLGRLPSRNSDKA